MKIFFLAICILCTTTLTAQNSEEQKIRNILNEQTASWNRGDIQDFMKGYWKSDSLVFIGKSGVTRGWQKTLDNYKRGYPDTAAMGKLSFDILEIRKIAKGNFFVIGKWFLKRSIGDVGGHYTLWFRKIKGQWKIVADHSS